MVFRKSDAPAEEKKPRIVTKTRKPDSKIKIGTLPDAIQNGAWIAPVGSELIVVKKVGGRPQKSFCEVKEISEDLISTWDVTCERWFSFKISELSGSDVIFKISKLGS